MNRMVAALALVLMCGTAVAAERHVVVNGTRLSTTQLEQLDALVGAPVQDGAYWLDPDTGIWGYADDSTPRGRIGAGSGGGSGAHGSFSERGSAGEGWIGEGDGETDWSGFRVRE